MQAMSAPAILTCRFCGRGPAVMTTLHRHTGMVILMQHATLRGPFCRECGMFQWKKMTRHSAVFGWWGLVSLFVGNPVTLILDALAGRKISRLAPPHQPAPGYAAPPGTSTYGAQQQPEQPGANPPMPSWGDGAPGPS